MNRRSFNKTVLAAAVSASLPSFWSCASPDRQIRALVLGGTNFVGPAIVNALQLAGVQITLFNRGVTNPTLFTDLPLIKGDRELGPMGYEELGETVWDVVIDVWPEKSKLVDEATDRLKIQTQHYIFISSIAVYNDFQEVGLHEGSEVVLPRADHTVWDYAEEKITAEILVRERFPDNHTIVRAGAIKGWRDPAIDLLYWCLKLRQDEEILAPGSGQDPLQFIDVNDVGRFVANAVTQGLVGTYNCVGPSSEKLLWNEFLDQAKNHLQSKSPIHWAPEDFLHENDVYSFSDLPLWAPLSEDPGFMQINNAKLVRTGFEFTPLTSTLDDCLKWFDQEIKEIPQFGSEELGSGLDPAREKDLIDRL
jgi:2'-hydroxyisoflavone reductase